MLNLLIRPTKIIRKSFPQTILIQRPFWGFLLFFLLLFLFVWVYHPAKLHQSGRMGYLLTMLSYCGVASLVELLTALIVKFKNLFCVRGNWTIGSELLTIVILLVAVSLSTYLIGFLIELPAYPFNFNTFQNSLKISFLVGIVPLVLPSLLNIRYAFALEQSEIYDTPKKMDNEPTIAIESKAKKEDLSFYPSEFLYAESNGNYVIFHLIKDGILQIVSIRNSISAIEKQFESIPYFMRTHRAFIVNIQKVKAKRGNALGYQLSLENLSVTIPVSRQNIPEFLKIMS